MSVTYTYPSNIESFSLFRVCLKVDDCWHVVNVTHTMWKIEWYCCFGFPLEKLKMPLLIYILMWHRSEQNGCILLCTWSSDSIYYFQLYRVISISWLFLFYQREMVTHSTCFFFFFWDICFLSIWSWAETQLQAVLNNLIK